MSKQKYLFLGGTLHNTFKSLGHPVRIVENHTNDGVEFYKRYAIYDKHQTIFYALDEYNEEQTLDLYKGTQH